MSAHGHRSKHAVKQTPPTLQSLLQKKLKGFNVHREAKRLFNRMSSKKLTDEQSEIFKILLENKGADQ